MFHGRYSFRGNPWWNSALKRADFCGCASSSLYRSLSLDRLMYAELEAHSECDMPEPCLTRNHPSGHLGGWAMPWLAEEMLDGQDQRWTSVPMPELLTIAACRKDWKRICWIVPHAPPPNPTIVNQLVKGLNWKQDPCRCAFLRIKTSAWLQRLCLNWRHHIRSNYWYLGPLNEIVQCWWIKSYSM